MPWTQFHDMNSGGGMKERWRHVFIEAPENEAKVIFYNRFDHNPDRVTCTCCGPDYSPSEYETLREATAYERGCRWSKEAGTWVEEPDDCGLSSAKGYVTLVEFIAAEGMNSKWRDEPSLFIYAKDIEAKERTGDVPEQGYVWAG